MYEKITCFVNIYSNVKGGNVHAAETDYSITNRTEFDDVNKSIDQLLEGESVDFKEMIVNTIQGKEPLDIEKLLQAVVDDAFSQIDYVRKTIIHIMIITIGAAILSNFSSVFNNSQISDISFYAVYTLDADHINEILCCSYNHCTRCSKCVNRIYAGVGTSILFGFIHGR
jgi:hypothetical protein